MHPALDKTPKQILIEARDYILDDVRWCQHSLAIDVHGNTTLYPAGYNTTACCAAGAVMRAARYNPGASGMGLGDPNRRFIKQPLHLLNQAALNLYGTPEISAVNDRYGHSAVVAAFNAAIVNA